MYGGCSRHSSRSSPTRRAPNDVDPAFRRQVAIWAGRGDAKPIGEGGCGVPGPGEQLLFANGVNTTWYALGGVFGVAGAVTVKLRILVSSSTFSWSMHVESGPIVTRVALQSSSPESVAVTRATRTRPKGTWSLPPGVVDRGRRVGERPNAALGDAATAIAEPRTARIEPARRGDERIACERVRITRRRHPCAISRPWAGCRPPSVRANARVQERREARWRPPCARSI